MFFGVLRFSAPRRTHDTWHSGVLGTPWTTGSRAGKRGLAGRPAPQIVNRTHWRTREKPDTSKTDFIDLCQTALVCARVGSWARHVGAGGGGPAGGSGGVVWTVPAHRRPNRPPAAPVKARSGLHAGMLLMCARARLRARGLMG